MTLPIATVVVRINTRGASRVEPESGLRAAFLLPLTMLHTIINNVRGSNGFDLLLMTINCTPRVSLASLKSETKLRCQE